MGPFYYPPKPERRRIEGKAYVPAPEQPSAWARFKTWLRHAVRA